MKLRYFIVILVASIVAFGLYEKNKKDAFAHASNHLVCTNIISETDALLLKLEGHSANGIGVSRNDAYIYDNNIVPEVDPQSGLWAHQQLYKVLPTMPQSIFVPRQTYNDGIATCNVAIQCPTQCTNPEVLSGTGSCDSSCNIAPVGGSCARYNNVTNFTLTKGGAATTVNWGDGTGDFSYTASPDPESITHTFSVAGKFDITTSCGCAKRYQVTCQNGGGIMTPTPYPTRVPTPTGGAQLCAAGLECMNPCYCDQSSNSYVSGSCGSDKSGSGGYGSASGTAQGEACAPGLVCCAPPSNAGWIKTKDVSLHRIGALTNSIPSNASAFDASDEAVCEPAILGVSYRCLVAGNTGMMTSTGTISLGAGYTNYKSWARNTNTYTRSKEYTPDSLIQYMLAHNDVVYIDDLSDLQANKINYLNNDYAVTDIDNNGLSGVTPAVVLIDNGDLRFNFNGNFNPAQKGLVFIVDGAVEFKSTNTEANGIFIANSFDFAWDIADGSTTTNPLLIRGNIISETATDCGAKRMRADTTKASCYFAMDFVNQYLTTLKMFSIQTYSRTSN